jgi:hypothetical protein
MKRILLKDKNCKFCKKSFNRGVSKSGRIESIEDYKSRKYCSRDCYFKANTGENHWYWKGGVKRTSDGYMRRSYDDRYLHRIVMEEYLGRKLKTSEFVHHINGNPSDNRIENLQVISNSEHRKLHMKEQKRGMKGKFVK